LTQARILRFADEFGSRTARQIRTAHRARSRQPEGGAELAVAASVVFRVVGA